MNRTPVNFVRRRRHGFTLVEAVVSTLIVGTLVVSALQGLGQVARVRRVAQDRATGMALAQQLMAEIAQSSYIDPGAAPTFGPESGETRANYNDVDDYQGLNESPPCDHTGTALAGFANWRQQVTIIWASPSTLSSVGTDQGLKKITITVTSPTGDKTTLSALRASSSAYEHQPSTSTTYVSGSIVTLQVGTDSSTKVVAGTTILNQLP